MKIKEAGIVLIALMAALALNGCAPTQAQRVQAEHDALCAALDTNKDGRVTKEEFMARATDKEKALEVYQKCDTTGKGYLTYDEVISKRALIPPSIYYQTPPVLVPRR